MSRDLTSPDGRHARAQFAANAPAIERQAQRMDRAAIEVRPTLAEHLADRGLDRALILEAERLQGEADEFARLTRAAGTLTLTDAAKVLGVAPKRLINWMVGNEWIFREGADRLAAHQRRLEGGQLRQRIVRLYRSDGSEKMGISVLVTAKGLIALAKIMADPKAGCGPWRGA